MYKLVFTNDNGESLQLSLKCSENELESALSGLGGIIDWCQFSDIQTFKDNIRIENPITL